MTLIIAITGPAGAGKSTIAKALSKQIGKSVNIDADHVKHFVVDGFTYDESPEGIKQWELLGKNIGMLARNYHDEGYNVIINGYINEPAWANIEKQINLTHAFLLLPNLETIKSRDQERHEDFIMGEKSVEEHFNYFSQSDFYKRFLRIDSSGLNVDQTVDELLIKIGSNGS